MGEPPVLTTARLLLRPFELSDARQVQRLAGDRDIAGMTMTIPHPYEDGMAEAWISGHRARFASGEAVTWAAVLRATGDLLGAVGLGIRREFDRAEIGYWIGKPWWGRGYCTEAARAVLAFGFGALRLGRIHACHFARNPASGRVLQKLGMAREGVLRGHVRRWHGPEDLVVYGILREEWERAGR
jgi:RimJ/RimL family protein N-acetyltransferase